MTSYPTASYSPLAPHAHVYHLEDFPQNHYNVPQTHTPYDNKQQHPQRPPYPSPNESFAHSHYDKEPPQEAFELPAPVPPIIPRTRPPTKSVRGPWQADSLDKTLLVLASVIPLITSTILLASTVILGVRSTGPLLKFTFDNRATTQIIVSILSAMLATLNMYTVTRCLSLATRLHLLKRSLSLGSLKLISAVSTRQLATEVPFSSWAVSVMMAILLMVPNFVFTGALTPVVEATTTKMSLNPLKIPQYSESSKPIWGEGGKISRSECGTVTNNKGTFSLCSAETIQSSIMNRGSQGTSDPQQIHLKSDNSLYNFRGRSYGVGATAGLVDDNLDGDDSRYDIVQYNYTEPGYLTNVNCFFNESMEFSLTTVDTDSSGSGNPNVYSAEGYFPYGDRSEYMDHFAVVGMGSSDMIAVMSAKTYANHHTILITAGSDYAALDQMQCELDFTPTLFDVVVSTTDKFITVTPNNEANSSSPSSTPFDPTDGLIATTINQLNTIGMTSPTLYTSTFGDALLTNINRTSRANARSAPSDPTPKPSNETIHAAISGSLSAMADDILLFVAASQFYLPNNGKGDFATVPAQLTVRAVRVGDMKYVIAAFAMCAALFGITAAEAIRTRWWRWLPKWDLTDPADWLLASAVAGEDVVGEVCRMEGGRALHADVPKGGVNKGGGQAERLDQIFSERWMDGGRDQALGVRLKLGKKVVGVVAADDQQGGMGGGEGGDYASLRGNREVRLAAVGLSTGGARDVASVWL